MKPNYLNMYLLQFQFRLRCIFNHANNTSMLYMNYVSSTWILCLFAFYSYWFHYFSLYPIVTKLNISSYLTFLLLFFFFFIESKQLWKVYLDIYYIYAKKPWTRLVIDCRVFNTLEQAISRYCTVMKTPNMIGRYRSARYKRKCIVWIRPFLFTHIPYLFLSSISIVIFFPLLFRSVHLSPVF